MVLHPLALAVLPLLGSIAQSPTVQSSTAQSPVAAPPQVHVDRPGDGRLWARGTDWKASFGADGMCFVPWLGAASPRNYPLALAVQEFRAGERAQPATVRGEPQLRSGHVVELARGAATERYALRASGIEQSFVFDRPLGDGDLVVRMAVQSELAPRLTADGDLEFAGPFGGVRYGRAVAIDAGGRSLPVARRIDGDTLELAVAADDLAGASYPLTIDPVLLSFAAGASLQPQELDADAAWLGTYAGCHAVVYEEVYSATDHDVYVRFFDAAGAPLGGQYVDFTTDNWVTPRIASVFAELNGVYGPSQFLVVGTRGPANGTTTIWGRSIDYAVGSSGATFTPGSQFAVQGFGAGTDPDVGGGRGLPMPFGTGTYCVVWRGQFDGDLYYNFVSSTGGPATNGIWYDPGVEVISRPRISKRRDVDHVLTPAPWAVVWQKRYSPTDEDIFGTLITPASAVNPPFAIDQSGYSETEPEVSSTIDTASGAYRFLVTYQRRVPAGAITPAHDDILGQLFAGTTSQSGVVDLTALLQAPALANQRRPCVDTDGYRFALGYAEAPQFASQDVVPYLATLHPTAAGGLGVSEYPGIVNYYPGPDDHMRICSRHSGGSESDRYLAVWDTTILTNASIEVHGCIYDGHSAATPFQPAATGCGAMTLVASGVPALGQGFDVALTGAQGVPFLLLGRPVTPTAYCTACAFGVDSTTALALFATAHTVRIPFDSGLIGMRIGIQGIDVLAPGGCASPVAFTLTDSIVATIL